MSSSSTSPLYEKASADLRVARFAISKLGQTFEDLQSHAFSIFTLNEQWKNLQCHFGQVEQTLSGRVNELEVKEREVASAKIRLENFEKEVELWKRRVEAGQRGVDERLRAVEMREKDVKERCEVMELEEGRVKVQSMSLVWRERKLLEAHKRVKAMEESVNGVMLRERGFQEREKVLEERERRLEEGLKEFKEREKIVEEREKEVEKRENEVEAKEKEVEKTLKKKEEEVEEWKKEVEQREKVVKERARGIEKTLQEREEMVDGREKEVEERENEVERTLKEREKRVEGGEKLLEEKEKELEKREKVADEVVEGMMKGIEEKTVVERENLVKEMEKKVDDKEKMVQERHKAVDEREKQLDQKAQTIEAEDKRFEKKRKMLEKKEEEQIVNFRAKEREIDEKENALRRREKEVTEAVELREKEFSKLEQELKENLDSQKALYLKEKEVKEALEVTERDASEGEKSVELRAIQVNEPSREIESKDEVMGLTIQADDGFGYVNNLFKNMDATGVKLYLIGHLKKHDYMMYRKVLNALRMAPDPAKLVLNVCLGYFDEMVDNTLNLRNKECCILLLEILMKLGPCISHDVLNEASDFASVWESNLTKCKNPLDAFGFFAFLVVFELGNFYNFDQLISISRAFISGNDIYRPDEVVNLCCSLGLLHKIPEFIEKLIREQNRLLAVKYICFFKQKSRFDPVALLEEHVASAKSRAAVKRMSGGVGDMNSALCIELDCLEHVLKCVVDFELEFEFPVKPLRLRISQLLNERKKRSAAKLLKKKKFGQQNAGSAKHMSEVSESSSCASAAVSFQGTSVNSQGEFGRTRKRNASASASAAPPEWHEKRPRLQQVQPPVFPGGYAPVIKF